MLSEPSNTVDGSSKLTIVDLSTDRAAVHALAALTGALLLNIAAFGVDHDLAQRFLVARSPSRCALFGNRVAVCQRSPSLRLPRHRLLLFIFTSARRDGRSGAGLRAGAEHGFGSSSCWRDLPPVVAGWRSRTVRRGAGQHGLGDQCDGEQRGGDLYSPIRQRRGRRSTRTRRSTRPSGPSRCGRGDDAVRYRVCLCYDPKDRGFSISPWRDGVRVHVMLAVFFTALLTRRGNSTRVHPGAAHWSGRWALMRERRFVGSRTYPRTPRTIAFTWALPIATALAFWCAWRKASAETSRRPAATANLAAPWARGSRVAHGDGPVGARYIGALVRADSIAQVGRPAQPDASRRRGNTWWG